MFETPSLSFVPCRPPGEPGVTRLWQDACKTFILIFDFFAPSYLPHSISAERLLGTTVARQSGARDTRPQTLISSCWCMLVLQLRRWLAAAQL